MNKIVRISIPILCLFVCAVVRAQPAPVAVDRGNLQRTGVYSSTPVAATSEKLWESDQLFVMKRSTTVMSVSPNWDYYRGDPPSGFVPGGASSTTYTYGFYYLNPVVHDGVIYFSLYLGEGYLFAVDAKTGKLNWKSTRPQDRFGLPIIVGDTMYFGSSYLFHAVNLKTRKELWNLAVDGTASARAAPLVVNGLVYFGNSGGSFMALDVATGERKWFIPGEDRAVWRAPVYGDNRLFCARAKGIIYAVNPETGKELWQVKDAKGVFTLLLNGNTLFYTDGDGFIHALDAATGSPRAGFQVKDRSGTHLAAVGDKLYFRGWDNGSITAVDSVTGAKAWKFENSHGCREPAIAGNVIYLTCTDEKVYALDAATGRKLWAKDTGQEHMSAPVIADGALYFIADDGKVHAIK